MSVTNICTIEVAFTALSISKPLFFLKENKTHSYVSCITDTDISTLLKKNKTNKQSPMMLVLASVSEIFIVCRGFF